MSRSLRFPLTVSARGGLALTPEGEQGEPLRQAIAIGCIEGETSHPWDRKEGLASPGGLYRSGTEADTVRAIDRRFSDLAKQGRAKLLGRPKVVSGQDGRKTVAFEYLDLERREVQSVGGAS